MCLAAILSLAAIQGCGGGGSGSTAAFAGTWEGSWESSSPGPSGSCTLVLEQHGATITGTATFAGHPCVATCNVSCQAMGHNLSGTLDAGPFQAAFDGSCTGPHHGGGPPMDTFTGTYEVHGGACDGEHGTIQLTHVNGSAVGPPSIGAVRVGEVIVVSPDGNEVVRFPVIAPPERQR